MVVVMVHGERIKPSFFQRMLDNSYRLVDELSLGVRVHVPSYMKAKFRRDIINFWGLLNLPCYVAINSFKGRVIDVLHDALHPIWIVSDS